MTLRIDINNAHSLLTYVSDMLLGPLTICRDIDVNGL